MKLQVIGFLLVGLSTLSVTAPAQSTSGSPVSKGVQYYSNKSLAEFKPMKIEKRGTPSFVQSKRANAKAEVHEGNVKSVGYPDWIISKPVNLVNK